MVDIIRLHGDPHEQTQMLLPWYANGTLEADEVVAVEDHLAGCAECREELKTEQALAREVARLPSDVDRGWADLRAQAEGRAAPAASAPAPWRAPVALLRRPVPIGWAIAAQAAAVAFMVFGLAWFSAGQSHPTYRALGSAPTAATGNVIVMFKPTTSERELRGALQSSGARLVDGPTASDAYVLHVAAEERASALSRLHADGHVIMAEPIDGDSRQ